MKLYGYKMLYEPSHHDVDSAITISQIITISQNNHIVNTFKMILARPVYVMTMSFTPFQIVPSESCFHGDRLKKF